MGYKTGYFILLFAGIIYFIIAYLTSRAKVHDTHSFVIGDRQIGLGLGVGALIAAWTYSVAIMISSGVSYGYGLSGMFWFCWPNGFAVMLVIPLARRLRRILPTGYTIPEFARLRFDTKNHVLYYLSQFYLMIVAIAVNVKGLSLAFSGLFGANWITVAILVCVIVGLYAIYGGIWTAATTGTIQTCILTVAPILIIFTVLGKVGPDFVFDKLSQMRPGFTNVLDYTGAIEFGILFAIGAWAQILGDQMFWQKVWSYKRKYMERIFMTAGIFFYPIPLAMCILGLVGAALGADVTKDLGGDIAGIAPWVLTHLQVGSFVIIAFAVTIMAAGFSTTDAAFTAVSSMAAVDLLKHYKPNISQQALFLWTKMSILITAAIAILVIVTEIPMTTMWLVLTGAGVVPRLAPFLFSIYWKKMNRNAAFWSVILGAAVATPLFFSKGFFGLPANACGYFAGFAVSIVVPIVWSLIRPETYDFSKLKQVEEVLKV